MNNAAMQWIKNHMFAQPPVLKFRRLIIEEDRIIYEWNPPKQYRLAFVNTMVPFIQEYRIDYKATDYHFKWNHTINTNSSMITKIIFYKMEPNDTGGYLTVPESYSKGDTRHEYGIFKEKSDQYDIRIYGANYAEPHYNYLTHTKLAMYKPEIINKIESICSVIPTEDFHNKYYIISSNEAEGDWKGMKDYIATSFMNGWIFFKPEENTCVDNFRYTCGKWVDEKLLETIGILIDNKQCDDTMFLILRYDFIKRIPGDTVAYQERLLKKILKEYRH